MTGELCERTWQVEAARDGRLDTEALGSFKLHLASCAACKTERETLERLALELSQIGSQVDEMALRRLRRRMLELANQTMLRAQPTRRRAQTLGLTLVASVAVAAAALFALVPPTSPVKPTAVQVEPQQNTQWRRRLEQNVEHVELSAGTLLFRVARKPNDPHLLVRVPDGEIEDLGTTFSVTVQDGRTREIVVREGRVMFHRRGAAALHLVAGSTWTPPLEPTASPNPSVAAEPRAADVVQAEPAMPTLKPVSPRTPAMGGSRAVARPEPTAVSAGNSEDASYLHMLALLREGRTDEARLAAFAYLRAFPAGFRKVEVERVATMQDEGDASPGNKAD